MKKRNADIAAFLDKKYIPLDKKVKLAIAAALLLVPIALYFFLFFQPKSQEIQQLESKKEQAAKALKEAKEKARKLPEHQAEMAKIKAAFEETAKLLPKDKEIPTLLTNISDLGRGVGLDFLTFKPSADIPKDFYDEIPIDIQVRGPYHNMGSFLDQVSRLDRIVSVSNIKMEKPEKVNEEMLLNSSCRLVTYRFTNKPAPQPADGKKK